MDQGEFTAVAEHPQSVSVGAGTGTAGFDYTATAGVSDDPMMMGGGMGSEAMDYESAGAGTSSLFPGTAGVSGGDNFVSAMSSGDGDGGLDDDIDMGASGVIPDEAFTPVPGEGQGGTTSGGAHANIDYDDI